MTEISMAIHLFTWQQYMDVKGTSIDSNRYLDICYIWQSCIELEFYSISYFQCITKFDAL